MDKEVDVTWQKASATKKTIEEDKAEIVLL